MRGTRRHPRPGIWELRVYVGNDPQTGGLQLDAATG